MFNKSSLTDPHIEKAIQLATGGDAAAITEIHKEIHKKMDKLKSFRDKAPILYEAIYDNAAESSTFKVLQKMKVSVPTAPKFDIVTFHRLVAKIKVGRHSYFPLRNFADHLTLHNPPFIIVPDPHNKHDTERFVDVDTAAATAAGEFVFNKDFMQSLLDWAHLKNLKAKDEKYKSNGGNIPDEYEYIEFLIQHELMHYTYSDFYYHEILEEPMELINWVGDFRSNHALVHTHGLNQLPVGLFSAYINYHKQNTYVEMVELVKKEWKKLDKHEKDLIDDHGGLDAHGPQGRGRPRKVQPRTPEEIDKHKREVESKAGSSPGEKTGIPGSGRGTNKAPLDLSNIAAAYNWQQLLLRMVGKLAGNIESTYRKISRRAISGAMDIAVTGRGAIKPGVTLSPKGKKVKLCTVIDSSGSMYSTIQVVMKNLEHLLINRAGASKLTEEFYFIPFSDGYDIYSCTMGVSGKYKKITSLVSGAAEEEKTGQVVDLLKEYSAGGTNFDDGLTADIRRLLADGYNVLICTDSDIFWGHNWTNFVSLYKSHSKQMFIVFDDKSTFAEATKKLQEASSNMSHF